MNSEPKAASQKSITQRWLPKLMSSTLRTLNILSQFKSNKIKISFRISAAEKKIL